MTLTSFVVLLVIAGICGAIGRALARYGNVGCLGSIALGFIGALLGNWIARHLHMPELLTIRVGGERFPVVWSIVGSALFVGVLGLLSGGRRQP
ncbi:MAG TPA: GlsB/YeaQ/YmgE family stress response membrane protein [Polyangiaceae bacterium]